MNYYVPILVAVLVTAAIWYFLGTTLARQRLTRWAYLEAGLLTPLGAEESFRWLGASGAEFRLANLRRPFTSLVAVIWVVPPWYAPARLLALARGQQTILGVAADLSVSPLAEFILADPSANVGQRALARAVARGWPRKEVQFGGRILVLAAPDVRAAERVVRAVERGRNQVQPELLRLAVQRESPQLSLSLGYPERLVNLRPPFARWFQNLATVVTRG